MARCRPPWWRRACRCCTGRTRCARRAPRRRAQRRTSSVLTKIALTEHTPAALHQRAVGGTFNVGSSVKPLELSLEVTPRGRLDVIDVRAQAAATYGDVFESYNRCLRSEERRVGKEWRAGWLANPERKKTM